MGAPPSPSPPPERAALSRDLADFLIELSIALHKHSMYPEDHPSLRPAAATVARRAELLLIERSTLSLGVARHQLVIEGVATDPKHPVLRELANRLHRHHLGAISFSRGVEIDELRDMLATLAVEAERSGRPLGLGPASDLQRWPHVRLHPLTYERLELVDDERDPEKRNDPSPRAAARPRGAQLWVGLARAALATENRDEAPTSTEPAVIAQAIDSHATQSAVAYDQAIVGYLLQIAEELKSGGSTDAVPLRRRMSRLVRNLKPATLRRLLDMGGDLAQRRKFVADATDGMAVDCVVDILQAAAETSQQTVSHALVRILSKLAVHAEAGTDEARPQADAALRQQVRSLIEGWSLDDPNPAAYGEALQRMARAAPVFTTPVERAYPTEPDRVAAMGLELEVASPLVLEAANRMIAEGRLVQLLDVLDEAAGSPTAARLRERVATPAVVAQLAAAEQPDFRLVERVALMVGEAATDPLLDGLAAAESRGARRGFLSCLARLGPQAAPAVARRLEREQPWYVIRNLLTVLDELRTVPPQLSLDRFAGHADARVRWQALKLQLRNGAVRERALARALEDTDDRVVRLGLAVAQDGCPDALVPVVARRAADRARSVEVRVAAVRALGGARAPLARQTLLGLTDGGRTFFGRDKLAPSSPELLAALSALAAGWSADPAARRVLTLAGASPYADVRAAAAGKAPSR